MCVFQPELALQPTFAFRWVQQSRVPAHPPQLPRAYHTFFFDLYRRYLYCFILFYFHISEKKLNYHQIQSF